MGAELATVDADEVEARGHQRKGALDTHDDPPTKDVASRAHHPQLELVLLPRRGVAHLPHEWQVSCQEHAGHEQGSAGGPHGGEGRV
jgi:hypothetical protein